MPNSSRLAAGLTRLQGLLPHHALTRSAGWLSRCRLPPLKNAMIRAFAWRYGVRWQEAAADSPHAYPSFNAFFTRALQPGARPVAAGADTIVCPCDGRISMTGSIQSGSLLQAKGRSYSLAALLADDCAPVYAGGHFVTIYLAPGDYHRVHAPLAATLQSIVHVPGRLFPVGAASARHIPGLFARNERLVLRLTDARGRPAALVLVGALLAGGLESVFTGAIAHRARGDIRRYTVAAPSAPIQPGDELGRFNFGSTVILVTAASHVVFVSALPPGTPVRMGQALARL